MVRVAGGGLAAGADRDRRRYGTAAVGGDASVLVTTDMLLDGTHFDLAEAGAEAVGYKAMAASLSDCAAMASVPLCAFAAALPRGSGRKGSSNLPGAEACGAEVRLCSGRGGHAVVAGGRPVGDMRYDAEQAGGALCAGAPQRGAGGGRYLRDGGAWGGDCGQAPEFRAAGARGFGDNAACPCKRDDGYFGRLSTDLNRICVQSGWGPGWRRRLPLSEAAGLSADPIVAALNDGEDFELLFTLAGGYEADAGWTGTTRITRVGEIIEAAA